MCDPITIASIALSAGSVVANQIGSSNVQSARNSAMAAERTRQQGFEQQAQALNTQSQDRYKDFGGQQDAKAATLGQYFTDQHTDAGNANAAVTQEMTTPQSGSSVVMQEEAKQRAKAQQFTDQQGNALGELRSFGDLMGDVGRGQARDAGQIGQIGNFMRGSSGVLPFELESANNAGDNANLIGDLLGVAGSVGLSKGLSGGARNVFPEAPTLAASADPWSGLRNSAANSNLYSLYGGKTGLF